MIPYILSLLVEEFAALNVVRYISFRAGMAFLSALAMCFIISPWFIRKLQKRQMNQVIREDNPKHFSKRGTPTMGGGLILCSILLPSFLWMNLSSPYLWMLMLLVSGFGVLGFVDDYLKIRFKSSAGVRAKAKLLWQVVVTLSVVVLYELWIGEHGRYEIFGEQRAVDLGVVFIPFFKNWMLHLGVLSIPFVCFVIVGSSNAVNLTDGLDGLAIGPVMIAAGTFAVFAYVTGNVEISRYLYYHHIPGAGELTIFAMTIIGAGLGFLWYNTYPAQVFMGDVGSLPLGAALGALAVFTKHEILWVLIGGIFVLETLSVITQVLSFRFTGRRIFRMAPIHHHFELKGWPEPKVIVRFWIIAVILAVFALLSLKLR